MPLSELHVGDDVYLYLSQRKVRGKVINPRTDDGSVLVEVRRDDGTVVERKRARLLVEKAPTEEEENP